MTPNLRYIFCKGPNPLGCFLGWSLFELLMPGWFKLRVPSRQNLKKTSQLGFSYLTIFNYFKNNYKHYYKHYRKNYCKNYWLSIKACDKFMYFENYSRVYPPQIKFATSLWTQKISHNQKLESHFLSNWMEYDHVKTVTTIIFHSIWKEMAFYFSFCMIS